MTYWSKILKIFNSTNQVWILNRNVQGTQSWENPPWGRKRDQEPVFEAWHVVKSQYLGPETWSIASAWGLTRDQEPALEAWHVTYRKRVVGVEVLLIADAGKPDRS
jgi:hypothetical protein